MKKIFLYGIVSCALLCISLTGCKNSSNASNENINSNSKTESTSETSDSENNADEVDNTPSANQQVLYEDDKYKISIGDIKLNINKYELLDIPVTMENKTDKAISVSFNSITCNNVQGNNIFFDNIEKNQTITKQLCLMENEYITEATDIPEIEEVRFTLIISDDASDEEFARKPIVIYPTGKTADTVKKAHYKPLTDEIVIVDKDNIKATIIGIDDKSDPEFTQLIVFFENNSDIKLIASCDDVKLNGSDTEVMVYAMQNTDPGNSAFLTMPISNSEAENVNAFPIKKINFVFSVINADELFGETLFKKNIEYKMK